MKACIAVTLLLCLAAAEQAAAQAFEDDSATITGVSGHRGSRHQIGTTGNRALYGVSSFETSGAPCYVLLLQRELGDGQAMSSSTASAVGPCKGSILPTMYENRVHFEGNPRYFVRGIEVCTRKSNQRLKGIRIHAARVPLDTRKVIPVNAKDMDDRPNCNQWHDPVFCPSGTVAWGLNLHYGDKGITGVGLRCKKVVW